MYNYASFKNNELDEKEVLFKKNYLVFNVVDFSSELTDSEITFQGRF